MRNIKFRGKRIDNGKFEYGFLIVSNSNRAYIISYIDDTGTFKNNPRLLFIEVDPETVGQYTGVKDKNGTEIYEGDIVKAWSQGVFGIFKIKWREDGGGSPMYILYPAYQKKTMWYISASRENDEQYYDRGLEVIGNIYDNPELMEAGNDSK